MDVLVISFFSLLGLVVPVSQNIRLEWHARAENKKDKRVLLGLNLEENMTREIANELGCELGE